MTRAVPADHFLDVLCVQQHRVMAECSLREVIQRTGVVPCRLQLREDFEPRLPSIEETAANFQDQE